MLVQNNSYPEDTRVAHEAHALLRNGYSVTIICPGKRSNRSQGEVLDGVKIYRFPEPAQSANQLSYAWEYAYSMAVMAALSLVVLFREGFDVIHAANPPDTLVFIAFCYKLLGKRFIYDHHDLAPEMYEARFPGGSRFIYRLLVAFEKLSCRLADHIVATNESYKAADVKRSGVSPDRITVVRNGPVIEAFLPTEPDPALRSRAKHLIAYAGVMGVQDGVDRLLLVLRHLVYVLGRRDFCCVLMGDGVAYGRLQKLARELGIDPYVWFAGWVKEPNYRRYLSSADICVCPDPPNPYNDRSTMIKIMEYMALGKPIVAFNLSETRFSAQGAALYADTEAEFAHALAALMDDPDQRATMGALGRKRVENHLAWEYSIPSLLSVYERIWPGTTRPAVGEQFRRKISRFSDWAKLRKPSYVVSRLVSIVTRYGAGSRMAKKRAVDCIVQLAQHGCRPTFAVPGRVVSHHARFCLELQEMGAELALHGHDHLDFRSLNSMEAAREIALARAAFQDAGIQFHGIRCPYLSGSPQLHESLPVDLRYTSNGSIWWEGLWSDGAGNGNGHGRRGAEFEALLQFYRPRSSSASLAVPRIVNGKLDIPASVPDDMQLCDGLNLSPAELTRAWLRVLEQTHSRGEIFVVLFHPELFERCASTFAALLQKCRSLNPPVWVAQLREISEWWWEKSQFRAEVVGNTIQFHASDRATILVRNVGVAGTADRWDGDYHVLGKRELRLADNSLLPFLGIGPALDPAIADFLQQQGYILWDAAAAPRCAMNLGGDLANTLNEIDLINYIENSSAPLVRFWRWPERFKSAISITGDLDALSLRDYGSRLFAA